MVDTIMSYYLIGLFGAFILGIGLGWEISRGYMKCLLNTNIKLVDELYEYKQEYYKAQMNQDNEKEKELR